MNLDDAIATLENLDVDNVTDDTMQNLCELSSAGRISVDHFVDAIVTVNKMVRDMLFA